MAKLGIESPCGGEQCWHGLAHSVTTVGRGKANTIVLLGDERVSLRHASIRRGLEGYLLSDENSTNGTWVNGARVEQCLLEDGDQIQIGDTVIEFRR